jgi:hypothetical protein
MVFLGWSWFDPFMIALSPLTVKVDRARRD